MTRRLREVLWVRRFWVVPVLLLGMVAAVAAGPGAAPPKPTAGPARELPRPKPPVATQAPRPDLAPYINFDRVQESTRADGTPCGIWNVGAFVDERNLVATGGYTFVLERRTGRLGTFRLACPDCTFATGPMSGGERRFAPLRQFNDCGYGAPYNPDFRVRADTLNEVLESNEQNNSKVMHFPVAR